MTDKKGDTASSTTSNSKNTPKKANLLDHHSIKHLLDESVTEIVTGKGFIEDVRMSNIRLLMGSIIIIIALFAQFYNKKFPENRNFLIGCIVLYILFNGILQLIIHTKEKNAILFTHPPAAIVNCAGAACVVREPDEMKGQRLVAHADKSFVIIRDITCIFMHEPRSLPNGEGSVNAESFSSTGLVVSSKLPRFSDMYTLTIESADPDSISAKPQVEFTKSVTQWFTKDGVLVEGLFWKDVEGLVNEYTRESKKSK